MRVIAVLVLAAGCRAVLSEKDAADTGFATDPGPSPATGTPAGTTPTGTTGGTTPTGTGTTPAGTTPAGTGTTPTGTTTTPPTPVCPDVAPAPTAVAVDLDCRRDSTIGAYEVVEEWTWDRNPVHPILDQVMMAPAVGPLRDTDGDGDADGDDVPVVVFTAFYDRGYDDPGALVAVDGATGATLWSVDDLDGHAPQGAGGVAIGNLDGSGPIILTPVIDGLAAVFPDGTLAWFAATETAFFGAPALGDLDGDGIAEIIYGRTVLEADGRIRWVGEAGVGWPGLFAAYPVDLDLDGVPEILAGNTVYENDGRVRWQAADAEDGQSVVADFDGDGLPEIAHVYRETAELYEADGTLAWTHPLVDGGGGCPAVADFDGDGLPELAVAGREIYRVLEGDGTELWASFIHDPSSSVTGSSAFDFDGDGAAEVAYADEEQLRIFDGLTGEVELDWPDHGSGTLYEYPLIVDVDADGVTELVVNSNDYWVGASRGITAFAVRGSVWPPTRRIWNQHAYHVDNVFDDGTVPPAGFPTWSDGNTHRAGSHVSGGLLQTDVELGEVDLCTADCVLGEVVLWVPVENRGTGPADVEVVVTADEELDRWDVLLASGEMAWLGVRVDEDTWGAGVSLTASADDQCDGGSTAVELVAWPCE